MTIIGLTGEAAGIRRIGRIYKGAPKDDKGRWGRDLDHFRIEYDDSMNPLTAQYKAAVDAIYPAQPKVLRCMLAFDDINDSWDAGTEAHLTVMIHRCTRNPNLPDPGLVEYAIDPKTGERLVINGLSVKTGEPVYCTGEPVAWYLSKGEKKPVYCKPIGRLKVVILGYGGKPLALPRIGFFRLSTHSLNDIALIGARMNWFKEIAARFNGGHVVGVPFLLSREEREIGTPESDTSKKRVKRKKSLIQIEPDPVWVAQRMADRYLTMPKFDAPLMIAEPDGSEGDDDEDTAIIEGETIEPTPAAQPEPEAVDAKAEFEQRVTGLKLSKPIVDALLNDAGGDWVTALQKLEARYARKK